MTRTTHEPTRIRARPPAGVGGRIARRHRRGRGRLRELVGSANTTTAAPKLTGSITVSAASSLTDAFGQLGTKFQAAHPGPPSPSTSGRRERWPPRSNRARRPTSSPRLPRPTWRRCSRPATSPGKPVIFARNSLEIVVKPGNPLGIHSLADLTKANVVAICVSSAPCGATADEALQKRGVTIPTSKITLGQDVDPTLAEVTTGDADAAIVYVTNAKTRREPGGGHPHPGLGERDHQLSDRRGQGDQEPALAQAWIAYVLGPTGQKVLRRPASCPPTESLSW